MRHILIKHRSLLTLLHDACMAGISYLLALYLRLGNDIVGYNQQLLCGQLLLCVCVCVSVFCWMRLYRGLWRYASLPDLFAIMRAVTFGLLLFYLLLFLWNRLEGMPRSLPFIQWLVLLVLLGGARLLYRLMRDRRLGTAIEMRNDSRIPVLLIGAGDRAELFLRDTRHGTSGQYCVVGIVDDKPSRIGRTIHGVPIYGAMEEIPSIVAMLAKQNIAPQRAILTYDTLDGARVRELLAITDQLGLPLARLPRLSEFKSGMQQKLDIRPIAIEDLLGRAQTVHDKTLVSETLMDKVVVVTGAGGTIGGELARQIASFSPKKLVLYELSEYALYQIDQEMAQLFPDIARDAIIGDVRNSLQLDAVFKREKPEVVFHAAAIKHVPLSESNPEEAMLTNIAGTQAVADACVAHNVNVMVMISTDKAVNPANVMGATKRAAERYLQVLAQETQNHPHFVAVRFGNVLGSTGSVVPLFQKQLAAGGPITVTHPDVMRYFMTVREAVELVLQAATLPAKGGEIYVLDMGQPVRIVDLAEQMIRLAGVRPHKDVQITYTGLRPGEKMFEELFHFSESHDKTTHESIWLVKERPLDKKTVMDLLGPLYAACIARRAEDALPLLKKLVPEYVTHD